MPRRKIDDRGSAATYICRLLQSVGGIDVDSMVTYKYYDYKTAAKA